MDNTKDNHYLDSLSRKRYMAEMARLACMLFMKHAHGHQDWLLAIHTTAKHPRRLHF